MSDAQAGAEQRAAQSAKQGQADGGLGQAPVEGGFEAAVEQLDLGRPRRRCGRPASGPPATTATRWHERAWRSAQFAAAVLSPVERRRPGGFRAGDSGAHRQRCRRLRPRLLSTSRLRVSNTSDRVDVAQAEPRSPRPPRAGTGPANTPRRRKVTASWGRGGRGSSRSRRPGSDGGAAACGPPPVSRRNRSSRSRAMRSADNCRQRAAASSMRQRDAVQAMTDLGHRRGVGVG